MGRERKREFGQRRWKTVNVSPMNILSGMDGEPYRKKFCCESQLKL
jgi:hypothetical protein